VQRYLEKSRYRKPVYIVTGLKTVRGAKVESRRARFLEGSVSAEVDGTAWTGAPVSGGLEAARKMGDRVALAWEGATDFVFAFRVQKVTVERKTGAGRSEDYKRGAMLDSEVEEKDRFELRIEEQDIDDHVDGFSEEELTEGDEVVLCALPDLQLDPAA
jgi:hypothetical protein